MTQHAHAHTHHSPVATEADAAGARSSLHWFRPVSPMCGIARRRSWGGGRWRGGEHRMQHRNTLHVKATLRLESSTRQTITVRPQMHFNLNLHDLFWVKWKIIINKEGGPKAGCFSCSLTHSGGWRVTNLRDGPFLSLGYILNSEKEVICCPDYM